MVSRNDAADGFLCSSVLLASDGLIRYIFERVRVAFSLHREIGGHGGVGHDQPHILLGRVPVPNALHCSNDLEGHAVDQQPAAYSRSARKENAYEFAADDAHAVALSLIAPIEPASLIDGLVANVVELRLSAINVAVTASVFAHQPKVAAVNHRSGIADKTRAANIEIVLIVQVVLARGKLTGSDRGHVSVVHLHVVFAKAGKILCSSSSKALSQSDQQQER